MGAEIWSNTFFLSDVVSSYYLAIVSCIVVLLTNLSKDGSLRIKNSFLYLFCFVGLMFVSLQAQAFFYGDIKDVYGYSALGYSEGLIVLSMFWFIVGMSLANIDRPYVSRGWILVVAFFFVWYIMVPKYSYLVDYLFIQSVAGYESVSHLRFADYAVLILMYGYVGYFKRFKLMYFIFSLFIVFVFQGRGALLCFTVAVLVYEYIQSRQKKEFFLFLWNVVAVLGVAFIFVVLLRAFMDMQNVDERMIGRMLSLFGDGGVTYNSYSYMYRINQISYGFERLAEQFWVGNAGLIVEMFGGMGAHMHNIFSAWQFFGFPFFLFMVSVLVLVLKIALRYMREGGDNRFGDFAVLMILYSVLSVLISRSFSFFVLWISLGYWLEMNGVKKRN